jgi:hypothetical protein
MKRGTKYFLLPLLTLSCFISSTAIQKTEGKENQATLCEKLKPCQLLSQSDAEKILGQPVRLTGDKSERKGDIRQCSCMYTAVAKDPVSGQDINLYFSFEQTEGRPSADQAHQMMASTRSENAHDTVIQDLSGIGDEAFRLGEQPNVHFIMARKGTVVIRLQIKEATQNTSMEELKSFAGKVARQL